MALQQKQGNLIKCVNPEGVKELGFK